ncbi:MAG: glycosyltransferase family 2 protein [Polyangiaceae bacterium]|jgi:1,2-diacylglycerol 3-beta-glucosyltransferase
MLVSVGLVVLSLPVLAWAGYLAALALLSRECRRPASSASDTPGTRFDVVVPAHDEAIGIASTVESLLAVDYPPALRRVIVVADNCVDDTGARAAAAGATVITRDDPSRRGKGYALALAFERSLEGRAADAVVVVDADTRVTPNLLLAFDARLRAGAGAVQAEYCVANPQASWRTRLMHIAFTLFHDVRSRARERLGVSAGLRGNGMAFSTALLEEVPHEAFSVVEDVEYGVRLGLAGHRVHYAGEARVYGDMVSSESASRSQRQRWEGGRWALARRHTLPLLRRGLGRGDLVLLDLAADLLVPPLTYVALAVALGVSASVAWLLLGHGVWWSVAPWCAAAFGLAIYVVRGGFLAHAGPRVILDLLWVPVYMVWKVLLALRPSAARKGEWVRTVREGDKP